MAVGALRAVALDAGLAEALSSPPGSAVRLWWLGQAGFVIDGAGHRLVVDPYLSDSLAAKYRGTRFPHVRLMVPPVAPHEISHVTAVLVTHAHGDHLDPGTLPDLFRANPRAVLIVPAPARALALQRSGIEQDRCLSIDAGGSRALGARDEVSIRAVRAAHEALEVDEHGRHRFLGYCIRLGGVTVLHTGDTVPFDGQADELRGLHVDIGLFPVNGRDARRRSHGIPGNMDLAEALALARVLALPTLIAHHFDLFEFNTVARSDVDAVARATQDVQLVPASVAMTYHSIRHPRTGPDAPRS